MKEKRTIVSEQHNSVRKDWSKFTNEGLLDECVPLVCVKGHFVFYHLTQSLILNWIIYWSITNVKKT